MQKFDCGSSVSAFSISPDATQIVVTGRSLFRLLSIGAGTDTPGEITIAAGANLRSTSKQNLSYGGCDVRWNPIDARLVASASTNGMLSIWNLSRQKHKLQERSWQHARAVNRIAWSPTDANLLLSACQDGSVYLFDLRTPGGAAPDSTAASAAAGTSGASVNAGATTAASSIYACRSSTDAVRDVAFSPYFSAYFGSVLENGRLQVWDMRLPSHPRIDIPAHTELALCLDWHPRDAHVLATASRDRSIRVWDLTGGTVSSSFSLSTDSRTASSAPPNSAGFSSGGSARPTSGSGVSTAGAAAGAAPIRQISVVSTIASVAKIKWDPSHRSRILSCAQSVDCAAHIFDTRSPAHPLFSTERHLDTIVCVDYLQRPGEATASVASSLSSVVTASKDGSVCLWPAAALENDIEAYFPNSTLSWRGSRAEAAYVTYSAFPRGSLDEDVVARARLPPGRIRTLRVSGAQAGDQVSLPPDADPPSSFVAMARAYHGRGRYSVTDYIQVCEDAKDATSAHLWRLCQFLLQADATDQGPGEEPQQPGASMASESTAFLGVFDCLTATSQLQEAALLVLALGSSVRNLLTDWRGLDCLYSYIDLLRRWGLDACAASVVRSAPYKVIQDESEKNTSYASNAPPVSHQQQQKQQQQQQHSWGMDVDVCWICRMRIKGIGSWCRKCGRQVHLHHLVDPQLAPLACGCRDQSRGRSQAVTQTKEVRRSRSPRRAPSTQPLASSIPAQHPVR